MSMVRSIRRNIARNNGIPWEAIQKRRHGADYAYICLKPAGGGRSHIRYEDLPKEEPVTMKQLFISVHEAMKKLFTMHPMAHNRSTNNRGGNI